MVQMLRGNDVPDEHEIRILSKVELLQLHLSHLFTYDKALENSYLVLSELKFSQKVT